MTDDPPYSPLARDQLGASVAHALLDKPLIPLLELKRFLGAGIYSLYYSGDLPIYAPIRLNFQDDDSPETPIYVGKAIPKGSRKGQVDRPGAAIWERLRAHMRSIDEAVNLNGNEFYCRHLLVEDIWIPLGESLLIRRFVPVWNSIIDGFGINTPGGGRKDQKRSQWDTLHPGRKKAAHLPPNESSADEISKIIRAALTSRAPDGN